MHAEGFSPNDPETAMRELRRRSENQRGYARRPRGPFGVRPSELSRRRNGVRLAMRDWEELSMFEWMFLFMLDWVERRLYAGDAIVGRGDTLVGPLTLGHLENEMNRMLESLEDGETLTERDSSMLYDLMDAFQTRDRLLDFSSVNEQELRRWIREYA
eukprot:jgi/Mesvir1/2771/Mv05111-RA.1